jgi:hypothetical protein
MGVGIKAIISDCHLPLVRNKGGHPGNELQVVHPLQIFGLFPITVADLGSLFIEREAFEGKQRPDHVFFHPLGLLIRPGPDQAVDVEAGVPPGEKAFRPFGAEKLPADKVGQDLAGEN